MTESTRKWLKSLKYLPRQMRDFHDQKTLFKVIHRSISIEKHLIAGKVGWIEGHCYVIDIFLWFMAMNGYTLQKNRSKQNFADLDRTIESWDELIRNESSAILNELLNPDTGKEKV